MLHVLGVQVVIKIHDGLESSQAAVEEQQQQLELSVGGAVGQAVLEDAQRLPHRVLVPCNAQQRGVAELLRERGHVWAGEEEENSPVSVHRSM